VDLAALSPGDLVPAVAREFSVPHTVRGLDALLSVLSDLDWMPSAVGYLWVLNGMPSLRARDADLFRAFAAVLVLLCDRWRSRSIPFRILIEADIETRDALKKAIDTVYREIRESPWKRDFEETPILDSDGTPQPGLQR
jgi:hypothetical protein